VKQQLFYHLLRIFIKSVRPTDGDMFIHNYIIKTIMLWTCESISSTKRNSRNLICTCKNLINNLANCLELLKCSSFFVTRQNLLESLENTDELKQFVSKLRNFTSESLCLWLIDNYIRQCAEQCPPHIRQRFHDYRNQQMLPRALSLIIEWRRSSFDELSLTDFQTACSCLQKLVSSFISPTDTSRYLLKYIVEHLHAIDSHLLTLFYAVCFMKVSSSLLDRGQSALQIADATMMLIQSGACIRFNDDSDLIERMHVGDTGVLHTPDVSSGTQSFTVCKYFQTASILLFTTRLSNKKVSPLSRLLTEISKIFLHSALQCRSLECEKFHITSRCLMNVLLTCLYLSTGQRNSAFIYNNNAVSIISLRKHQIAFCHVERQLLPYVDKTLETILGLVLFYGFLQQTFSNENLTHDVFTADLLAFYLMNLTSDVYYCDKVCKTQREMYNKYKICLLKKEELTVADVLIFYEIHRKTQFSGQKKVLLYSIADECKRHVLITQSVKFSGTRLSKLLVQSAVELLTTFRESQSRDFSPVRNIVTSDFEAMYAYKCHLYEECFCICEKIVDRLLHVRANTFVAVFGVNESDLLHLVDDECLSLISLAKLCGVFDFDPMKIEDVTQLTLSMYLLIQSKLHLMHSTATIIETLRKVMIVHQRHDPRMTVNRAIMVFIYRKAMRLFRLTTIQRVVV
jgi:hypothetical protein